MKSLMHGTSHYLDIGKNKEVREISNPLIYLVVPTGIEPVFSA